MTKIITICQNKGGVGKTTITSNLGAMFALDGKKVLFIDLDSQGNLSQFFGYSFIEDTLKDFLEGFPLKPYHTYDLKIKDFLNNGFDIVPNNIDFELWKKDNQDNYKLKSYLDFVKTLYDYIIIDTPPSLDSSLDLALIASDYVLIVMEVSGFALNGLENLLTKITNSENKELKNLGLIMNKADKTKVYKQGLEHLKENYEVFETSISKSVIISESQLENKTVFEYKPKHQITKEFQLLYEELKGKL